MSFVGSTPIAEYVQREGVAHGKRVQALGGAKNHLVMLPDADATQVCDALLGAAYGSAGERCMAISVAVAVGDATADRLVGALAERVRGLRVDQSQNGAADMGPLITAAHRAQGHRLHRRGCRRRRAPGRGRPRAQGAGPRERLLPRRQPVRWRFVAEMKIYREEIFGPVLVVVRVATHRRRDQAGELARVRQWHGGVHARRRRGARLRAGHRSGNGGRERAHSRAHGVLQFRRLAPLDLLRPRHARHGRRAFLHAPEDRHQPLARRTRVPRNSSCRR